jgi:dipeptidyl aminopeptidase/acylaminoacyl peptidase
MLLCFRSLTTLVVILLCQATTVPLQAQGLQGGDLYRFRAVSEVQFSIDGRHIAYSVTMRDRPERPYSQIWIMDVGSKESVRIGSEREEMSHPRWSPDGKMIAYSGEKNGKQGLMVARADGSGESFLAPSLSTNSPLPNQGESFTWSPDSKKIAFISATPGPETQERNRDPISYGIAGPSILPHYEEQRTVFMHRKLHVLTAPLQQSVRAPPSLLWSSWEGQSRLRP